MLARHLCLAERVAGVPRDRWIAEDDTHHAPILARGRVRARSPAVSRRGPPVVTGPATGRRSPPDPRAAAVTGPPRRAAPQRLRPQPPAGRPGAPAPGPAGWAGG